jgi:hypothetical protein
MQDIFQNKGNLLKLPIKLVIVNQFYILRHLIGLSKLNLDILYGHRQFLKVPKDKIKN